MTLESKSSASVHPFERCSFTSARRRGDGLLSGSTRVGRLASPLPQGYGRSFEQICHALECFNRVGRKKEGPETFFERTKINCSSLLLDNKRFGSFDAPIPFFRDRTRDLGMPENLLQSHALPTELRRGCLMMFQAELHTETLFSTNRRLPPRILHWRPFRVALQEAVLVRYVAVQLRLGPDHSAPS